MIPPEVVKIANNIRDMKIRGAAEIGRAAVYALSLVAQKSPASNAEELVKHLEEASKLILATRPTAVTLPNGIQYIMHRARTALQSGASLEALRETVIKSAQHFIKSSQQAIKKIGEIGARRIRDGDVILTHCNSSAAISIILTAHRQGKRISVYATETRPRFQGRLTAKILHDAGVPVTLIIDSAVRYFMHEVDKVVVGADAVTANGAVVNKIGTSMIALSAHEARVRVFVAAETYKFSPYTALGELVEIEERPAEEVVPPEFFKECPNVKVRNPAFDVTPPEFIDIIITEKGVIPPQGAILVLKEEFGWALGEELSRTFREE